MFTMVDTARLLLAALLSGLVIALPGVALARSFRLAPRDGLVAGLAVLPLVDSLVARLIGLDAALAVTLALAAFGAALLVGRTEIGISKAALALCAAWLAIVVFEWVDFDSGGRLYQPFTVIDAVKHAATTQAIVESGAPPVDPFFLRGQHVSYYYFFYLLPALVERLGFGLVDARAAVGGCVAWVGLGLYGLVRLALERAGFAATAGRQLLVVALLAAAGLDILGVLRMGLGQGTWLADPISWNEQTTGWLESTIWVPHHVCALISGMLGLMALAALGTQGPGDRTRGIVLAAMCFASTLGLSVWLTLVLVVTAGLWSVVLVAERRWQMVANLVGAGAIAMLLALPQIRDLIAGREGATAAAIVPTVRAFSPVEMLLAPGAALYAVRFVALPLNYFAGFGGLASGALFYWRTRESGRAAPEFARVLVVAAIAGLALGAFLKSTLFNNDLGWRVVLFPMLAALVWTVAALERLPVAPLHRRAPAFLLALLAIGWLTTAHAIVSLRTYPWTANQAEFAFMSADPATERALRVAYAWADANLRKDAVLQHDPTRPRAFAFALYGRHRVAVADDYGSLFGADPRRVDARITALAPIFTNPLSPAEVRARATTEGVDDLVVTAADPVWREPTSFVWRAAPAYASDRVRIVPVAALTNLPPPAASTARADLERGD